MDNKKGIVSISLFSLIVFILFGLLVSSYFYYEQKQDEILIAHKKIELSNSLNSFKSNLIEISYKTDSYINYSNELDSTEIFFEVEDSTIIAKRIYKEEYIIIQSSLYGILFCDTYKIYPADFSRFYYDGNCIEVLN